MSDETNNQFDQDELQEFPGGFVVPERPDYDGLEKDLLESAFTFKRLAGGANVWLDGSENGKISDMAARNGFTIQSVKAVSGPFAARVEVRRRGAVRNINLGREMRHRVEGGD